MALILIVMLIVGPLQSLALLIFILLLVMIAIGSVQLLWALISILFTRRGDIKRHLGYYLIEVLGYFIVMYVFLLLQAEETYFSFFFLCVHILSAWALAYYHLRIVLMSRSAENEALIVFEWPFEPFSKWGLN